MNVSDTAGTSSRPTATSGDVATDIQFHSTATATATAGGRCCHLPLTFTTIYLPIIFKRQTFEKKSHHVYESSHV